MPRSLKRERNPLTRFGGDEVRRDFAEMPDGLPVHLLGDFGGPRPVRVRERVAPPGRRVAHKRQLPLVQAGVVAYLREARRTGEMAEDEHDEVACRREFPRVHAVCVRALFDEPARDPLDNLPQSMIHSRRRLVWVCFIPVEYTGKPARRLCFPKDRLRNILRISAPPREAFHSMPMG